VPFEALTGLKAFVVANALTDIGAPKEIISPLVRHLPKLWELVHHYGITTLELNPIRMRPGRDGRPTTVACDFNVGSIVTIRAGSVSEPRRARRHLRLAQLAIPVLRLRQRNLGGRQLREKD
jgi:hypothetical protein